MLRAERAGELLLAARGDRSGGHSDVDRPPLLPPLHPRQLRRRSRCGRNCTIVYTVRGAARPRSRRHDDLAQEILLRLYKHIGRLREQDRFDAWAYQVARNVIADYWRDRPPVRELPLRPGAE